MNRWWRGRSERERRALAMGAVALALMLLIVVWVQAERSRERLAAQLPALRASIAALERDAQEVKRLRAMPARATASGAPLAALASGAIPGARVTVVDERRVRIEGDDVAFAALLEWLGRTQASHGLRVESASVEALDLPGRVKARLVLARS